MDSNKIAGSSGRSQKDSEKTVTFKEAQTIIFVTTNARRQETAKIVSKANVETQETLDFVNSREKH